MKSLTARLARLPDVSAMSPPQPAGPTMSLIAVAPVRGPLNWWAPRPLRPLHERIGLHEGPPVVASGHR
jgi:hypothetical protein